MTTWPGNCTYLKFCSLFYMIWDYCENSEITYIRGPALDGHRASCFNRWEAGFGWTELPGLHIPVTAQSQHWTLVSLKHGSSTSINIFGLDTSLIERPNQPCRMVSRISQPLLIKCQQHPSLIVTTKNVSRHCHMFPQRQNHPGCTAGLVTYQEWVSQVGSKNPSKVSGYKSPAQGYLSLAKQWRTVTSYIL